MDAGGAGRRSGGLGGGDLDGPAALRCARPGRAGGSARDTRGGAPGALGPAEVPPPTLSSDPTAASAYLARSLFSGTNVLAMNVAPCGSPITVIRTQGASNGGTITFPPSSVAFAAAASASSTAKVTLQCAGVSGWSPVIGLIVATTSSNRSGAPASAICERRSGW